LIFKILGFHPSDLPLYKHTLFILKKRIKWESLYAAKANQKENRDNFVEMEECVSTKMPC